MCAVLCYLALVVFYFYVAYHVFTLEVYHSTWNALIGLFFPIILCVLIWVIDKYIVKKSDDSTLTEELPSGESSKMVKEDAPRTVASEVRSDMNSNQLCEVRHSQTESSTAPSAEPAPPDRQLSTK